MNKSELTDKMAELAGLSKKDAGAALDAAITAISQELTAGGKVQLVGFGSFEVKQRAARMGKNPRTGEEVPIPAGKTVAFKCGKALKDQVNS